ncbi:tetratricopeptide repeat protein [Halovivax gelatinilyticus]|uniref:tetratricopeptide repeat protein n=1 Tax=Halovivax gelatinilyticus TaxID=2961597 RepID=UPI0020CA702E|nr:tetratricopeptide repeat protein [Halovivax gelatinilyticus]
MRRAERTEETEALIKRIDVLDRLCESSAYIRDLVDDTGQSRSTINRAVAELKEIDLVDTSDEGIEATIAGRLARDRLDSFLSEFDDVLTAEAVLDPLAPSVGIEPAVVAGGEAMLATGPTPYRPLERVHDDLNDAESYRALVPALEDPRTVRLLYEHVITDGNPAELVVSPEVFESLRQEFPRRMAAMADTNDFSVLVGPVPPYGLATLVREPSLESNPPSDIAHLVVMNEHGGVHGALVNESTAAVTWAESRYAAVREEAIDRTDALIDDADDVQCTRASVGRSPTGLTLPVSLEREGFIEVDESYFREEPVADPATAWRTGLSLGEVHTGYAVARTYPNSESDAGIADRFFGDDNPTDGRSTDGHHPTDLATAVSDGLVTGSNSLVLGPPGSGKSTVCKQVACEWYAADRGPVLYREYDRGRSVSSIDDLAAAVADSGGHALVIVEDAVRADANAIFGAIERLEDCDDVSVLLDARESEWREYASRSAVASELAVAHVPPLRASDCERLVDHFERTVGKTVDVSADRLWSTVRGEASGGHSNELLRLIHRLAPYADPLAHEPTALEEAVGSVSDALDGDEVTLSVSILANVLNAAGVDIDRGLFYSIVEADRFDAVDAAIDRLEGVVLFAREDGSYRTVHEEWSTAFLAHRIDAGGEKAAAQRFGAAVSALLALADDPDHRREIVEHLDGQRTLAAVTDDPASWVDETVEAVYAIGRRRSQLAALFGDGSRDAVELPDACSDALSGQRPIWLGRLFLSGGYYDRAERAFERVNDESIDRSGERLLGLARVSINRGEYDEALAHCEACLSLVDGEGREVIRARAQLRLGEVLTERGEYDDAKTNYDAALETFCARGLRGWEASARHGLGTVAGKRSEFDRATEQYETSLRLERQIGDRRGEAETITCLGNVAWKRGGVDRASELFERSLELRRELGDRAGVATALGHLGVIEGQRGNHERAAEFHERSLERKRELGDRSGEAKTLHNLGHLESQRGNFDRAVEYYEQSLERKQELGDRPLLDSTLNNLGTIEGRRGEFDRAAELHERSLALKRELGDRHGEAFSLHNLGQVEHRRGSFDRASELHEQCVALMDELDNRPGTAPSLGNLGLIAARRGEYDRAQEYGERCLDVATEAGDPEQIAAGHRCLGEIALRTEAYDRARTHFDAALDALDSEDGLIALQVRLASARLSLALGEIDRARSIARAVYGASETMTAVYWVGRSSQLLGRIESDAGTIDTAREHLLDALETFERIGALYDALRTLEWLFETGADCSETADAWRERARVLLADAPESVRECHRELGEECS